MALFKAFRETVLPGTLVNDSLYVIAPAGSPNHIELYAVNSSGQVRRIPTETDINNLITAAISANAGVEFVADITARDALAPTSVTYAYVDDASADGTVTSGGASYVFNPTGSVWIKTAEFESLDVSLDWGNIQNKPTSTVAQIDAAVAASHSHANLTELNNLGEDNTTNELTYNGVIVKTEWASVGW